MSVRVIAPYIGYWYTDVRFAWHEDEPKPRLLRFWHHWTLAIW